MGESSLLSNVNIREAIASGQLAIENLQDEAIQPASIDLHLGNQFRLAIPGGIIDPYDEQSIEDAFTPEFVRNGRFVFHPHDFLIAVTKDVVSVDVALGAQVDGKSGVGRLGILVHLTTGFIDPGFNGPVTLEMVNLGARPVWLYPGMFIGQLVTWRLDSPADAPYNGGYVGSTGPVLSRYWKSNRRPE